MHRAHFLDTTGTFDCKVYESLTERGWQRSIVGSWEQQPHRQARFDLPIHNGSCCVRRRCRIPLKGYEHRKGVRKETIKEAKKLGGSPAVNDSFHSIVQQWFVSGRLSIQLTKATYSDKQYEIFTTWFREKFGDMDCLNKDDFRANWCKQV